MLLSAFANASNEQPLVCIVPNGGECDRQGTDRRRG